MATLTTRPAVPIPGRKTSVIVDPSNATTNWIRLWCTVAPADTQIQEQISSNRLARSLVYEGPPRESYPWRYTFEKGGAYTLKLQEYIRGNAWGGGYDGDPRGAPSETKNGSEQDLTLYIAERLTQRLGFGDDTATLVVFVLNDTVVRTLEQAHGQNSPAIVEPSSERAETAASTGAIATALGTLVGASSTTLIGDPGNKIDHYIERFRSHAADATIHDVADDQADLFANYIGATGFEGMANAVTKLRRRYELHLLNARENVSANPEYVNPGSVDLHNAGGLKLDLKNALLPISVSSDPATIYAGLGDFWRAYEAHRPFGGHPSADATYTLTAPVTLLLVHKEFMTSLAAATPTAGAGQSAGSAALVGAGFEAD
ncbi:MAG TPA: hypothetical protein VFR23_24645 [Jiangellaceae bacterium]|nr:hypothetical protein [Jiangellaceae bacterium]